MNINKKAILVVSIGTIHKETREKTINSIEEEIKKAYPNYSIYRAFTSKLIIKKLIKNDNLKINTINEALEKIINDNIKELIIQPTHIVNGIENNIMIETISNYKDKFESIKIGDPLLTSTKDYNKLIDIIIKKFSYLKENEALICVGHGSNNCVNSNYERLNYMFKEKGFKNIFVVTIKGYSNLSNIILELKNLNPKKITLMPLMFVSGNHVLKDIIGDNKDSWKSILEDNGFKVEYSLKSLGEYKEIRKIYIEHIKEAKLLFKK